MAVDTGSLAKGSGSGNESGSESGPKLKESEIAEMQLSEKEAKK